MNQIINALIHGAEVEGGFFAGVVVVNGLKYGVVVSPKTRGEFADEWGNPGEKIEARHLSDGLANTQAMAAADSKIATQALGLDINGFQDWYIPARDELELIYRNLKPTPQQNWCTFRDGENPSSVPVGILYTDESPGQTSVDDFRAGRGEAMDPAWYWSSTQSSADYAFVQHFYDGCQSYGRKGYSFRVRAVRRFLID